MGAALLKYQTSVLLLLLPLLLGINAEPHTAGRLQALGTPVITPVSKSAQEESAVHSQYQPAAGEPTAVRDATLLFRQFVSKVADSSVIQRHLVRSSAEAHEPEGAPASGIHVTSDSSQPEIMNPASVPTTIQAYQHAIHTYATWLLLAATATVVLWRCFNAQRYAKGIDSH